MVAGNFGKSNVAAAPTLLANQLTFTTQQKLSIQSAIVELEDGTGHYEFPLNCCE